MLRKICRYPTVIFIIVLIVFSCDYQPASYGSFQKIVVYADSTIFHAVQKELEQVFDQFIYTPNVERSFNLDLQPLHTFETYQTRRNIIFVGILNQTDEVSKFIDNSLSAQVKTGVREGRVFEIIKEDLFASQQVVMFFPATNIESLRNNLINRSDIIFNRLQKLYFKRLEYAMFLKGEQFELEEYLAKTYGWQIRVQHDYRIILESEDRNFFWLRRFNPDRSMFITRIPQIQMDFEQNDWLYAIRDSLTTLYYEADSIDKSDSYIQVVDFNDYKALKLIGVWQNHTHRIGGPFRTYVFNDSSIYTYLIDMTVTAPGQDKKVFLDQLDVMARSFHFVKNR